MEVTMERISALTEMSNLTDSPLSIASATSSSPARTPFTVKVLGVLILVAIVLGVIIVDSINEVSEKRFSNFIGGVTMQPSNYNDGNVTMGWETMKVYPDIQAVRIEIEPDQVEQSKEWIRQASEQGYHMVVTYHKYSALGSDDVWELQAAAAWWQTNYASMSEAGTFDVNLMNEWYAFIQLYIDVWQIRFSLTVIHTTFISRSIVHFLSGVRIASQPRHTPMHTTLP